MEKPIYTINKIAEILSAEASIKNEDYVITQLLIDTRLILQPESALFLALDGHRDGHLFIEDAYKKGIRNFLISERKYLIKYADANFLVVNDVLKSLQKLAKFHRKQFDLKTIAITGSNGKTIVKEWLCQLLASDFNIVKSPKSYNSQIGVPLSVWQISEENNLGIFEAGISTVNEMQQLEEIIQPQIGILTNIGQAHAEGFASETDKLEEKLKLFKDVEVFIYPKHLAAKFPEVTLPGKTQFSWSGKEPADLQVIEKIIDGNCCFLKAVYKGEEATCRFPFIDTAHIENGLICWATLLSLGYKQQDIVSRLTLLSPISMRLALKDGINNCTIIDDSYSADISSLIIALDFLNQQNQHTQKTAILSDFAETGHSNEQLYGVISNLLQKRNVQRLIGIGPNITKNSYLFPATSLFFPDTASFLAQSRKLSFNNETILVKGARTYQFEKISKVLTRKVHDTVLEVNLNAMLANLQQYRAMLRPGVKIMAVVKAFSYGSGSFEIANLLQFHGVDYLAVAYADEGVALRDAGISLPIMVMSPEEYALEAMIERNLEPEIFSLEILKSFMDLLPDAETQFPIHIKLDTGMHRLGFNADEIEELGKILTSSKKIKVKSIFSHFVASDAEVFDEFSRQQIEQFTRESQFLISKLGYRPILHLANTSGISRFPEAQLDMVRLGIGLYGFDGACKEAFQRVATLKTTVTQVKELLPGETVGYHRIGKMPNGGKVATVKIGFADGYNRGLGNGVGHMMIANKLVPTLGSICMDMTILDVTGLDVKPGDEVIVFGENPKIGDLADQLNTITYEVLTNVSQRVKRVYFYE
ncbi:alanine racemase [Pedobacter sp. UYP30]|uniref:bifunctional UDP-N-acetylmuramoyl-tripeptide:D-alanyl-D-alanine ligase/alanine racemase n=1 Tax=Pedobacter sp. UYP30 TaxID=1756400 RepID=UPI003394DC05